MNDNNKSIIVIDTPENCDKCRLMHSYFDHGYGWIKECIGSGVNDCIVFKRKLEDYCPLKSLPKKKVFTEGLNDFQKGAKRGWNDCLDKILGEEFLEYCDVKDAAEENKIPIGFWYEDTDKRKPSEEMIYRKTSGEEYMWKDDMWVRIK